jgi:PAS domain S-box-containing protein
MGREYMSNLTNHFTNKYTHHVFVKNEPVDLERHYDGTPMITETDTEGIITYANRYFLEFTGFEKQELIGLPHSVIRHPDMPRGLYYAMWKIIREKKIWRGYIKSMCKDGSYFWALVYIQPKLDENGEIMGYVANRRDPYPEALEKVKEKYAKRNSNEYMYDSYFMQMELYHGDELATFQERS